MDNNKKQKNSDTPELSFRWHKTWDNQEVLQVKNNLTDSGISTDYAFMYFIADEENTHSSIDPDSNPGVFVDVKYNFETELNLDDFTNIKLARPNGVSNKLCVYVNDKPTCLSRSEFKIRVNNDDKYFPIVKSQLSNFISSWETTKQNQSIELPLSKLGVYNFFVNWGDGCADVVMDINDESRFHTYEEPGTYIVSIFGRFSGLSFEKNISKNNICDVMNWGCVDFTIDNRITGMFYGCANLKISAIDAPHINQNTNLKNCFRECKSLEGGLEEWDVSLVKDFTGMFLNSMNFNGNISKWNLESAISTNGMFGNCKNFNQNLSNWNVSCVRDMGEMFQNAKSIDFCIANWNVESVENFNDILSNSGLSNKQYSKLLCAWSQQNLKKIDDDEKKFSAIGCEHSIDAKISRNFVLNHIGIKDSGITNDILLESVSFVTVAKIKSDVDSKYINKNDCNFWKELSDKEYDAFIIPLTKFDNKLFRIFSNSYSSNTKLKNILIETEIFSNKAKSVFNMNHNWKLLAGVTKISEETANRWNSIKTISTINNEDFKDEQSKHIKINLEEYLVVQIADKCPTKIPHSENTLHQLCINLQESKFDVLERNYLPSDENFCYFNDSVFGSEIGYNPTNRANDNNSGSIIFRNNDKEKFIAFSTLVTDEEFANNAERTMIECKLSYHRNDKWTTPCNINEYVRNIPPEFSKMEINKHEMKSSFGFHFNDDTKLLTITRTDENNTSILLLKFIPSEQKFILFKYIPTETLIPKTIKTLSNKDIFVCNPKLSLMKYDKIKNDYESGFAEQTIKIDKVLNNLIEVSSCKVEYIDEKESLKKSILINVEKEEHKFLSFDIQKILTDIHTEKASSEFSHKRKLSNKTDKCLHSNIFGKSLKDQKEWGVVSVNNASNSFVYFNGEFDVETLNESETFPVIISSNGKSSIFNFHTTRILGAVWLNDYLVTIELSNKKVKSQTLLRYYVDNLNIRCMKIDSTNNLKLKEVISNSKLSDVIGKTELLKILKRFCNLSVVKDNIFGTYMDRMISIKSDPNSDNLCFILI